MGLNDLEFTNADFEEVLDYGNLPEERGGKQLTPPGDYTFQLPRTFEFGAGEYDGKGYLKVVFKGENALLITEALNGALVNTPWEGTLTGIRFSNDDGSSQPSTIDRLISVLDPTAKCKSAKEQGQVLEKQGGKSFRAHNEWSAKSNKKRVRWIRDASGAAIEDPEGNLGGGTKFKERQLIEMGLPDHIDIEEGDATVVLFPQQNLVRFTKA